MQLNLCHCCHTILDCISELQKLKIYEGRHAYMSDKAGVTPTQAGQQSKLNSVEGRVLGSSNTLSKIASQPSP